jgi:methyl-accepting chemotaxis protein
VPGHSSGPSLSGVVSRLTIRSSRTRFAASALLPDLGPHRSLIGVAFNTFEPYQIEFIEKVGENIASFVSSIKINHKTSILLNESQHKSEELAAQEEEMRQNMEELQATQEEAARREEERELLWDSMGKFLGIIETDLNGFITNSNEKVTTLLGIGANELLHANYQTLFFTDSKTNFDPLWNQIISGGTVNTNSTWKGKGSDMRIDHELTLVTDLSGKGNKVLSLIKEIK